MTRRLRVAAAAVAALAAAAGTISASAAGSQWLGVFSAGCVTSTDASGGVVVVTMTCAAAGFTPATADGYTAGLLTVTVEYAQASTPCPASDTTASIRYQDASGTAEAAGGGDTWSYVGNDTVTGAPLCQLTASPPNWSAGGTGMYAGMDEANILGATIPGTASTAAAIRGLVVGDLSVKFDNGGA